MEVRLLGEVAVAADVGRVPIEAPLARRCVGALALASGGLSLDGLADALWGDGLPESWKPALRNVVAKLRLRLDSIGGGGSAVIATTPTGYRLAADCTVDVYRALSDADAADEKLASGDPDGALELAMTALERVGEELVPGIDADWLTGYRTRVGWARTRTLQVAAGASRAMGHTVQAVDLASRAVMVDPLVEESHRQLIEAHAAAGDRAAALKAYEACRRTLEAELGIAPDHETTGLHLRILGTEEALPATPRMTGPFFGRDGELATLRSTVTGGRLVTIVGPGGIGKSRLAAAFATDPTNGFDGTSIVIDVDGQGRGSDLTTTLASAIGVATGGATDAQAAVLAALAIRGDCLLVLDGIDRIADEAAGLITAVLSRSPTTAILATCRVSLRLDGEALVRPGPLDPESDGHACFVAYATASGASLAHDGQTSAVIADVCRAVGGIPLGIELAGRQIAELSLADLADRLKSTGIDEDGRAAELVGAVVDSTIALLDDVEMEVFRRLAVLGGPADLTLVEAAVADDTVPARRVVRVLAQLADRALVRLDRSALRWRYDQHPLLRAAAMARLTDGDRRDANTRLATALFARLPPTASEMPRWSDIDLIIPAVRSFLDAALAGDADPHTALRMTYWLHRYWATRAIDEGVRWTTQLLAIAADDDAHRGPAEFALGYMLLWSGRLDAGRDHLRTATSLIDARDPLLARSHYFIGNSLENLQPDLARRHFALAIDAARGAGDDALTTRLDFGLAWLEFEAGERDVALERYATVLASLEGLGDSDQMAIHLSNYAAMLVSMSNFDEAHTALQRVEELLAGDVRITSIVAAGQRARLERHRGHLAAARRHAVRAAEMIDQVGLGRLDGVVSPTLALLELADGDAVAAAAELARGAKAANASEFVSLFAEIVDASVLVAVTTDQIPVAIELKRSADSIRASAQVQRGDPEQAELDSALSGVVGATGPAGPPELDRAQIADLIAGLTAD